MTRHGIVGHRPPEAVVDPNPTTAPDLIGPDITCIPTDQRWLHLAWRHLIGWLMSDRHRIRTRAQGSHSDLRIDHLA